MIDLVDDVEHRLVHLLGRGLLPELGPDRQVQGLETGTQIERIGRLLHPVVHELEFPHPFDLVNRNQQFLLQCAGKHGQRVLVANPCNTGEQTELEALADAGTNLHRLARGFGKVRQAMHHQVDHVVGRILQADAVELPAPAVSLHIESKLALPDHVLEKLAGKEGVALGLAHHLAREPKCIFDAMAGVLDQLRDMGFFERADQDLDDLGLVLAQVLEHVGHRVGRIDLVVAIGTHHQQMCPRAFTHEGADQCQRGKIGPLEVIEKHHQRMLPAGKELEELRKNRVEALLRGCAGELGRGWAGTDQALELRQHVDHHAGILAQGLDDALAPSGHLGLGLAEHLTHQALEGLDQCRIWGFAVILVELAFNQAAPGRDDMGSHRADQRRLADAGVATDHAQHDLAAYRPVVDHVERGDLLFAPIKPVGNQKLRTAIDAAELEAVDRAAAGELLPAVAKVVKQAGSRGIARLGRFCQQLENDFGQRGRNAVAQGRGRLRADRHVMMHQIERIIGPERQPIGQQFVKNDAQGIEIAAHIDTGQSPCLLWRHVAQPLEREGLVRLRWNQRHMPPGVADESVRAKGAMHASLRMQPLKRFGKPDRPIQKPACC